MYYQYVLLSKVDLLWWLRKRERRPLILKHIKHKLWSIFSFSFDCMRREISWLYIVVHINSKDKGVKVRDEFDLIMNLNEKAVNQLHKELFILILFIHRIIFSEMKWISLHDMLCTVRKTEQKELYKQDGNRIHIFQYPLGYSIVKLPICHISYKYKYISVIHFSYKTILGQEWSNTSFSFVVAR